ncbi:MAG: tRNA (adenosine(37)-N6)-threonylcarbamoyltransferase complex transferase subunit TsaD [Candidatus Micrarchaeota archaeon]|nr:tRNA (adenosine(37)-N6)-threonylcarbamoyltransferase complex transferase subunit TsaD [Candidatus Micrarchaeota archaeon]MDE1833711.1 tRNA (adenosine(37)-N6)-threonylcarbamoyltransferase complex transferase subunit TsaD [Candidatus Micrarchaeota archaeon]MDE1859759.1 tRNA (adenosine(37)-N6)-threonylcarbamoyltransferase complex transferase subunit TsaD [Candidatus Micrarchaeota archaeon]
MLTLGIESSAHTFGVGIADNGKILANEKAMYKIELSGMIPKKVAEHHVQNVQPVISAAISKAAITPKEIEGIGYTKGPGIGTCLQVGQIAAKTIARKLNIPIVPVNHGIGHIEIARINSGLSDPLVLYVSGGNSQILKLSKKPYPHYGVMGETFDIGIGNMLDTFARETKLNPAWGSTVEKLAKWGRYINMPYTVKGMDFSFTGILTHSIKAAKQNSIHDVCFSLQETAFSMLCEATERALLLTNSTEMCVCGGVAQNSRLKEMLESIAKEHKARLGFTDNQYNADNGAMIAFVAERMLKNGAKTSLDQCKIEQRYRIDQAKVY